MVSNTEGIGGTREPQSSVEGQSVRHMTQATISGVNNDSLHDLDDLLASLDTVWEQVKSDLNIENPPILTSKTKSSGSIEEQIDEELEQEIAELSKYQEPEPVPDKEQQEVQQDTSGVHEVTTKEEAEKCPCGKTLTKVERFFVSLLKNKFFHKIFPSFITSKMDASFAKYADMQAEHALGLSKGKIEEHRRAEGYEMNLEQASEPMEVSHELLQDPKQLGLHKELKSHQAIARQAVEGKAHEDVPPFDTQAGQMLAFSFEATPEGIVLKENEVTPTSYLLGSSGSEEDKVKGSHLTNAYVIQVDGKDYGIIRTGVINTEQKANEFVALLQKLQQDIQESTGNPDYKLRVVSQQLNSFEGEAKLINQQHRWINYANTQMQEKGIGEVIHINVPSNRWYHFTKALESMGTIGSILTTIGGKVFGNFGKGERLSKEQNLDSLGTYVKWASSDIRKNLERGGVARLLNEVGLTEDSRVTYLEQDLTMAIANTTKDIEVLTSQPPPVEPKAAQQRENDKKNLLERLDSLKQQRDVISDQMRPRELLKGIEDRALASKENLDPQINQLVEQIEELKLSLATKKTDKKEKLALDTDPQVEIGTDSEVAESTNSSISQLNEQIEALEESLDVKKPLSKAEIKRQLKEYGEQLATLRQEKKEMLIQDYKAFKELEGIFEKQAADPSKSAESKLEAKINLRKVSAMAQVLGSQLDIPGVQMSRGKQGMMIQQLNAELGVTSAINCKSGLDRTGFWHAVKLSLESFADKFTIDSSHSLVDNWDTTTSYMNQLVAKVGSSAFNEWLSGAKPLDLVALLGQEGALALGEDPKIKERMKEVIEFRKMTLNNLIKMGIPITGISTGLLGVKWNTGMQENLIPLNFLPPSVKLADGRIIQLVRYDKKTGEPIGMTPEGRKLITKFQSFRGS
jgi:hypothetical protein